MYLWTSIYLFSPLAWLWSRLPKSTAQRSRTITTHSNSSKVQEHRWHDQGAHNHPLRRISVWLHSGPLMYILYTYLVCHLSNMTPIARPIRPVYDYCPAWALHHGFYLVKILVFRIVNQTSRTSNCWSWYDWLWEFLCLYQIPLTTNVDTKSIICWPSGARTVSVEYRSMLGAVQKAAPRLIEKETSSNSNYEVRCAWK